MTTYQRIIRWLALRCDLLCVRRDTITQWVEDASFNNSTQINTNRAYARGLLHAYKSVKDENP